MWLPATAWCSGRPTFPPYERPLERRADALAGGAGGSVRRAGQLSLELRRIGDAPVLSARGDIDLSTVEKAGAAMDEAREEQRRGGGGLFLDLREVRFMDTSGLRLVIAERQRAD